MVATVPCMLWRSKFVKRGDDVLLGVLIAGMIVRRDSIPLLWLDLAVAATNNSGHALARFDQITSTCNSWHDSCLQRHF